MSTTAAKKDKNLLHLVIYCVIAAMGWLLPVVEPITPAGMKLLGVFVAAIYGWSVTTEIWPSLLTIALIPFTGITTLTGLLTATWGSDTVLFMIFLFVMIAFLEETGSTSYMASFLMSRKFLKGHPWRLIFMIMLVSWVHSTFCNNVAGMMIGWGFVYKICDVLGYKPFDKFANLMVFGVAVMGALSLSAVPWGHNALVILGSYMQSSGQQINFLHYLAYSIPFGLFSIFGFMLLCKFVFRLDVSRLKEFDPSTLASDEMELTKERKIALISLAVLILWIVIPSVLPAANPVRVFCDQMGLSIKAMLMVVVLSMLKVEGKKVFNFGRLATKGVQWNMVLMIVAIYCFVGFLGSSDAGIGTFLGAVFTPLFKNVSPIMLFVLVLLITILLTNFMINMVVAVIMISATVPVAVSMGILPLQIVYLITISCTIAFMLPSASAASCILFANTQWVRPKDVYKYSVPTIIMMGIIALVWNLVLFSF